MNPISRAINIIIKPNLEWQTVAMEPASPAGIAIAYVMPLAAIGPIFAFLGSLLLGQMISIIRVPLIASVITLVFSYIMSLVITILLAIAVNLLATAFGGRPSFIQAFKLVAYAMTPSYLAGVGGIIPFLGIFIAFLGGCYSIFLVYLGLPYVMGTTKEKAPLYTLAVVGCGFVIGLITVPISFGVGAATFALTGGSQLQNLASSGRNGDAGSAAAAIGSMLGANSQDAQNLKDAVNAAASAVPETSGADPSASTDPAQAAAAGVNVLKSLIGANKNVVVVPRDQLASLLPTSFGDFTKTGGDSSENSVSGIKGTSANASYKDATGTLEITVTDLGNASGLASFANTAANMVESSDDEGYEKNVDLGGNKVHESWKNASKHSEILGIIGGRFSITVDSDGSDMGTAEQAYGTIDLGKLNDMAAAAK